MAEESKNKLIPTDEVIDAKIVAALEEPLRKISEHDKSLADKAESSSVYDKTTVDSKVKVLGDAVAEHVANNTRHISDSEREIWNNKPDSSEIYTRQQSDRIFASFSHEHTNDGWFVSVINAVKKLIPALPSWLTPTREEPPTKEEVASKADKSALDAHIEKTNNPHTVTAAQVGAVPFVEDKNGNKMVVTIGGRKSGEPVGLKSLANGGDTTASGYCSHAEGDSTTASGYCSHAEGSYTTASGYYSHAEGYLSQTKEDDIYAFAWNGDESKTEEAPYKSNGPGTFNINPLGGLDGFYIGEQTLASILKNKVGSFADVGGATATVDNSVAKLDNFFTESNSLLNGRLAYSRNATRLKDRAFNTLSFDGTEYNLSTALAAVTPTASGQPRDLLIVATATAATTISFTAGTIKGDKPTIDGSGTWLITLTEYASGVWYCRQIKMEDAA